MEKIKITNRSDCTVGYKIPEKNLARYLAPNESRIVDKEELQRLIYQPGGQNLIDNYFQIEDLEAAKELSPWTANEPEYYYTQDTIKKLLTTGTIDELLDCLDFAPQGVIELVKHLAVKFEVNDIAKRQAILEKTGFNVTNAITINHETEKVGEEPVKTRRATTTVKDKQVTTTGATRRTTPKYNVTKIEK